MKPTSLASSLVAVLASTSGLAAALAPADFEITSLPGLTEKLNFNHLAVFGEYFSDPDACTFFNPNVTGIIFIHWHIPKSGGSTVGPMHAVHL